MSFEELFERMNEKRIADAFLDFTDKRGEDDEKAITWAMNNNVFPEELPSEEEMQKDLNAALAGDRQYIGKGAVQQSMWKQLAEQDDALDVLYVRYVLVARAHRAYRKATGEKTKSKICKVDDAGGELWDVIKDMLT